MNKKTIEKLAENRKEHSNRLEYLLAERKKEIKELKEEIEGHKQVRQILEAIIIEGIAKQNQIKIPVKNLSKGIEIGYKFEVTEDGMYVITKKEEKDA